MMPARADRLGRPLPPRHDRDRPVGRAKEWLAFLAAWMTLAIGSIPQQDVFQRVTSAKDEKTAVRGALLGGAVYFCFAFVPVFIAYSALVIDPGLVWSTFLGGRRSDSIYAIALDADGSPIVGGWTDSTGSRT